METKKLLIGLLAILLLLVTVNSAFSLISDSLEISDVKINGLDIIENGVSPYEGVKPNEDIILTFEVTNNLDHRVYGIGATFTTGFTENRIQFKTSNQINLESLETKTISLQGKLPLAFNTGEYDSDILVSGKDFNNNTLTQNGSFDFKLKVVQDYADLSITKLSISPSALTCSSSSTLNVELTNNGANNEDDIIVTVKGASVDLTSFDNGYITLNKNQKTTVSFNILKTDLNPGSNTLNVKLSYRNGMGGNGVESGIVNVDRNSCLVSSAPSESSLVVGRNKVQDFAVTLAENDLEDQVKWSVNNQLVQNGGSTYDFSKSASGDYTVKVVVNDKSRIWNVKVTDVPVTTKFTIPALSDNSLLQNYPDFYLENQYGIINFTEPVDLTTYYNLDDVVVISNGLAAIDTTKAPGLDSAAKITFKKSYTNYLMQKSAQFNSGAYSTCTSCALISNENGKFIFSVLGFSTYRVMEVVNPAIQVSNLVFSNASLGKEATLSVVITNLGTIEPLTNLKAELANVDSSYKAQLLNTLPSTLAAQSSTTLNLKIAVPDDEPSGSHGIGSLKISSTENTLTKTIYLETESLLKITKVKINGDTTSPELTFDDNNDVEVKVLNSYNDDLQNVAVTVKILDVDGNDLEETSEDFDLDSGDDKTVTLSFDLSEENLDKDDYIIEVSAEGEVKDNANIKTSQTYSATVKREKHQIVLSKASFSSSNLQCSRISTLSVDLQNVGKSDEDNVDLKVSNTELGIELQRENIVLDGYSGSDNEYSASFSLNLEEAKAGSYDINVEVYRDGNLDDPQTLTVKIEDCADNKAGSTQNSLTTKDDIEKLLSDQLKAKVGSNPVSNQLKSTAFRESNSYLLMLGALVVLVLMALVLALMIFMKKKKSE